MRSYDTEVFHARLFVTFGYRLVDVSSGHGSTLVLVERIRHEADVVDLGWTWGLGFLAVWYAFCGQGDGARRIVIALVVGIWSLRLGTYLLSTRVLKPGEDAMWGNVKSGDPPPPGNSSFSFRRKLCSPSYFPGPFY